MIALIASAMADLMPRTQALPGVADTELHAFLSRMRRESDALYFLGLCVGALLYHATPLITVGVPLPAPLLPARIRERHAQRVVAHRLYGLRQAVSLVRLSAGMCWGADPAVRARFELAPYPPDPGGYRHS